MWHVWKELVVNLVVCRISYMVLKWASQGLHISKVTAYFATLVPSTLVALYWELEDIMSVQLERPGSAPIIVARMGVFMNTERYLRKAERGAIWTKSLLGEDRLPRNKEEHLLLQKLLESTLESTLAISELVELLDSSLQQSPFSQETFEIGSEN